MAKYFEYDKDFVAELSKILAKTFDRTDYLAKISKTYTGVLSGDKVGIRSVSSFQDVGVASCNPNYTSINSGSAATWDLANLGLYKYLCFDDLDAEMKRAQKLYDLESNEAAMFVMKDFAERALTEALIARSFFASKTAADNVTPGLDQINGFLTQMLAQVSGGTADASQVVPISTNSKAWGKTGTNAVEVLENLIDAAPASVKNSDNAVIITTQALWDCVAYDLKINKGLYIESQWTALFGGLKETTYGGYRVVVVPALDNIINQLQSGDVWYNKPLIGIFTSVDNLFIGSSSNEAKGIDSVDIFNDKTAQVTRLVANFSLGALVPDPKGWALAY